MFDTIRSLLGFESKPYNTNKRETLDTGQIVQSIREQEQQDEAIGRKILSLDYQQFELLVDREFTGRYRISAFKGQHKIYGFTVSEKEISDQQFKTVWNDILKFLDHPSPNKLPESEQLSAHFFGHPE